MKDRINKENKNMKKCNYCGAQIEDGDLFCTECGKPVPKRMSCPHCGASVSEEDAFCQNCGKKIAEESVLTSTETLHDPGASRDGFEVQVNDSKEIGYNNSVEDETRTWRDKILYILGAVVIIGGLGFSMWNYYSSNQRAERNIALADSLEKARQDSIKKAILEKSYKDSIEMVQKNKEEEKLKKSLYIKIVNDASNRSDEPMWQYYFLFDITHDGFPELWLHYQAYESYYLAVYTVVNGKVSELFNGFVGHPAHHTFHIGDNYVLCNYMSMGGCTWDKYIYSNGMIKQQNVYSGDDEKEAPEPLAVTYELSNTQPIEELLGIISNGENINQYSRYVGRWTLRKTTDEGRKMLIEVTLKENHSGELAVFHDRGNVADVVAYEEYPQCILNDGVIYMTKNGEITKGTPQLRVGSDGLYSFDGGKYVRKSE